MKRRLGYLFVLVVAATLFLGGCAVNQSYSLLSAKPDLQMEGNGRCVSVMTQDRRSYVVSGRNDPWIAGLMRGGWGNPFYITVRDQRPLAEEMNTVLVDALKNEGFDPLPVSLNPTDASDKIAREVQAGNATVGILLSVNEWRPDLGSGGNLGLTYDLEMSVLDRQGAALGLAQEKGHENIGVIKGFTRIIERFEEYTANAFQEKVEHLLNAPDVVEQLR